MQEASGDAFAELYTATEERVNDMKTDIEPPRIPRVTRPPKRLEQHPSAPGGVVMDAKTSLRRQYYETVDTVANKLQRRFDQPDLKKLERLENLFKNDADISPESVKAELGVYGIRAEASEEQSRDIYPDLLAAQMQCARACALFKNEAGTISELCETIDAQGAVSKAMLSEVCKLAQLVMTVPVSAATAERSFSTLRRIKTDLRSTLSQKQLCSLMLLNIHGDKSKAIDPEQILREFVRNHPQKSMGVTLYTFEVPLGTPMKKVGTSGTPMLEALLKV